MIKHFNHSHATVAEVRECTFGTATTAPAPQAAAPAKAGSVVLDRLRRQAGQELPAVLTERKHTAKTPVAKATSKKPAFVAYPASEKAKSYAMDLIEKRDANLISLASSEVMMHLLEGKPVSAQECSLLIDDLRAAPRKDVKSVGKPVNAEQAQAEGTNGPTLRDLCADLADKGYYALRTPGTTDEIHYYRITRGKKGYVKVQEQASDTLWPVDYKRALKVVAEIIKDAAGAQDLYGATLERCYRCGRTLTDETSRALRIGPECRSK